MKQQKLQIFLNIIRHYFDQFNSEKLVIDTPYIANKKQPQIYDYTGVIDVTGSQEGAVYFSATRGLLSSILDRMGESDTSEAMFIDLAGEVANTISGNARKQFGSEYCISTPFIFKGTSQSKILPSDDRSLIIPITWQSQAGEIVICLQD